MAKQTVPQLDLANLLTPERPPDVSTPHACNDPTSQKEVVRFLRNRLSSERQYLATERSHLTETTGCLHDLTQVHITLLENDISGTEKLLKEVMS